MVVVVYCRHLSPILRKSIIVWIKGLILGIFLPFETTVKCGTGVFTVHIDLNVKLSRVLVLTLHFSHKDTAMLSMYFAEEMKCFKIWDMQFCDFKCSYFEIVSRNRTSYTIPYTFI